MSRYTILSRTFMILLTAFACTTLIARTGAWTAAGIWIATIGLVCGSTALVMRLQPPGRVTPINYIAGIVLPWGYAIGRGRLLPIVLESWFRWALLGGAIVLLAARSRAAAAAYHPGPVLTTLLLLSWIVMAAAALRLITHVLTRANDNPIPPGTFGPILAMLGLLAASVALTAFGHTPAHARLALLLTGAPVAVIAGGYGLMMLVMLTFGRHARWN